MDTVTLALSSIVMVALALMIAPSVLRLNRGVALRNIALWIGIFCLLALAYKHVGPGRQMAPSSLRAEQESVLDDSSPEDDADVPATVGPEGGYLPPRE